MLAGASWEIVSVTVMDDFTGGSWPPALGSLVLGSLVFGFWLLCGNSGTGRIRTEHANIVIAHVPARRRQALGKSAEHNLKHVAVMRSRENLPPLGNH